MTPAKTKSIPAIANKNDLTNAQKQLIADRAEWTKQYDHWLLRKNKFYFKLRAAGRTPEGSKKYQQLDEQVKKYHTLLRDSLPEYRSMFVQRHQ